MTLEEDSHMGSSPRGRGKPGTRFTRRAIKRLIPAWAGKTPLATQNTLTAPAHPRVGGENFEAFKTSVETVGSSPRGRGKLRPNDIGLDEERLIPAWAGKTLVGTVWTLTGWAHPRVGGENPFPDYGCLKHFGSSPRGRGKLRQFLSALVGRGLIPAWAGKTWSRASEQCQTRAHPRVGGENLFGLTLARPLKGSSPRGRGKPTGAVNQLDKAGLIPAWAGKTVHDHFRVKGQNVCPESRIFTD